MSTVNLSSEEMSVDAISVGGPGLGLDTGRDQLILESLFLSGPIGMGAEHLPARHNTPSALVPCKWGSVSRQEVGLNLISKSKVY